MIQEQLSYFCYLNADYMTWYLNLIYEFLRFRIFDCFVYFYFCEGKGLRRVGFQSPLPSSKIPGSAPEKVKQMSLI